MPLRNFEPIVQKESTPNMLDAKWAKTSLWVILAVGAIVIALTFQDYGIGWDESIHSEYAELVIEYFRSGGENTQCNRFFNLPMYSPAFDLVAALLYSRFPEYQFEVRHALSAALGLLTVPALYLLGKLLGDAWVGVIGGACLLLLPRFYGHAFVNMKDIPFACLFAWSMYALTALFTRRAFTWKEIILCGLAMGLTVFVRPGGWLLLGVIYVAVRTYCDFVDRDRQVNRIPMGRQLTMFGLAWLIMVATWPWAHANLIMNPIRAIGAASSFSFVTPVVYGGETVPSDSLPRIYLLKFLLMTTPPAVLLVACVGLTCTVWKQLKRHDPTWTRTMVCLQLWFLLPIVLFIIRRPNVYDGLRHFLFLLPALAIWFGIGARWIICSMPTPLPRSFSVTVLAAVIVWPVNSLVNLHPYQMTFFNSLAGGLVNAEGQYETDYWLTSYREAMEWVNRQSSNGRRLRILVAANRLSKMCAQHYCGENVELTFVSDYGIKGALPDNFDFYVATYRYGMADNYPDSPVIQTIGRYGARFTVIRGREQTTNVSISSSAPPET